ncbi:MAG: hypothetical protein Tsb009_24360 [Planctomycetaceae bacterium]
MNYRTLCLLLATLLLICAISACNKKKSSSVVKDQQSKINNSASTTLRKQLIGKWEGVMEFDEQLLIKSMREEGATPQRISEVVSQQKNIQIFVVFRENNQSERRMFMKGKQLMPNAQDSSWKIVKDSRGIKRVEFYGVGDSEQWIPEFSGNDILLLKTPPEDKSAITGYRLRRVQ